MVLLAVRMASWDNTGHTAALAYVCNCVPRRPAKRLVAVVPARQGTGWMRRVGRGSVELRLPEWALRVAGGVRGRCCPLLCALPAAAAGRLRLFVLQGVRSTCSEYSG